MALTVTSDAITGDRTRHTARPVPGHPHAWEVSWLPGRHLSRDTAITAMVLANAEPGTLQPGGRLWPHVEGWAAEIGLTASDALALVCRPPGRATAEKDGITLSDPEAAG